MGAFKPDQVQQQLGLANVVRRGGGLAEVMFSRRKANQYRDGEREMAWMQPVRPEDEHR